MSRTHRPSHRETGGDDTFATPWRSIAPRAAIPAQSRPEQPAVVPDPAVDFEVGDVGDVGTMTVGELADAAQMLRVPPGLLLGAGAQDRVQADLHLMKHLPGHVAELALEFARLRPDTAAVLASMIDRYAAAARRPRTPRRTSGRAATVDTGSSSVEDD